MSSHSTIYGHGSAVGTRPPAWIYTSAGNDRRPPNYLDDSPAHGLQVSRPTFRTVAAHYRTLRKAGLPVWRARTIVGNLLWAGAQCSHFTVTGRPRW